jgi:SAM-dependent methyltransferase
MSLGAFSGTAAYYDLLYRNKDYVGETAYILSLLQRYSPGSRNILEFGCGTGRYTKELAALGYEVLGIDLSQEMLQKANQLPVDRATFTCGDMRTFRADRTFDAAIAMFHVVSYLTGNDDLEKAFCTVANHLEPGGVFLFDCWYGPAVLTDRPTTRIRRMSDDRSDLVRIAEPKIDAATSTVRVDYQLIITDRQSGSMTSFSESHYLRYLFEQELSILLAKAGLALEHCEEFLSGQPLGFSTWYGCFLARKQ